MDSRGRSTCRTRPLCQVQRRLGMGQLLWMEAAIMTLFWLPEGPRISHDGECLRISDLNPEVTLVWRMNYRTLFFFGVRCMFRAVWGPKG